jgi:hypothetical protein
MTSLEKVPAPKAFKGRCPHQKLTDTPRVIDSIVIEVMASVCGEKTVGYRFLDGDYTTLQLTWCAAGHVVVMNKTGSLLDVYERTVWDFVKEA